MKTEKEMLSWIRKNAKGKGDGTVKDKARWFGAYATASETYEANMIKDWAYLFLNGIKPVEVQTWLDERHENAEPDEDMDANIVSWLRNHFGIKE